MYLLGVVVVVGALLAGGLIWQTKRVESAQIEAALANEVARENAGRVHQMQADQVKSAVIISDLSSALARFEAVKQETIREIIRVPVTTQCASSPAVGVALERLRQWSDRQIDLGGATPTGRVGTTMPPAPTTGQSGKR